MDYTDFEKAQKAKAAEAETGKGFWWQKKRGDKAVHESVCATADSLIKQQAYRSADNLHHLRLYGGAYLSGFGPTSYFRTSGGVGSSFGAPPDRISLNVVQACADAITARVARSSPKPTYLTSGGNWFQRQKAKLLNKFTAGQFYETKLHDVSHLCQLDAAVLGTGCLKVYEEEERIKIERILCEELTVDDAESIYGQPRQMFQSKSVSREVLIGCYPKHAAELRTSKAPDTENVTAQTLGDMVQVREAWHLPSSAKATDGRHVICCDNVTLRDEPWTKPYFPFVFLRWSQRLLGFWGQGLAEQLSGIQLEINKLLKKIREEMKWGVPRTWVEKGSQVVKDKLSNEIGGIGVYQGQPPTFQASNAVPREQFEHLERLYAKAFEISGISQLAATSQKPAGLNSSVALNTYEDIQSERFTIAQKQWDRFHLDAARMMVDLARDLWKRAKAAGEDNPDKEDSDEQVNGYRVVFPDKRWLERVDFGEIGLEENQYVSQCFPTSSLPATPAPRLEMVAQMVAQQWVSPEEGRRLLNFPDLESSLNLAVAALEDIDYTIDSILEKGKYLPPEPYQDLEQALPRFQSAYLRARAEEAPEKRLELLRRWMAEADALVNKKNALNAAQLGPAAAGALPPGMEGAPPMPGEAMAGMGALPGVPPGPAGMPPIPM